MVGEALFYLIKGAVLGINNGFTEGHGVLDALGQFNDKLIQYFVCIKAGVGSETTENLVLNKDVAQAGA